MENILEVRNLVKKYPGFTLDNINIDLPQGVIMGFIGENGAGKTTTIKLILDLLFKDTGEIRIFGRENTSIDPSLKEQIGVVFDESNLPENLTVGEIEKIMTSLYKTWNSQVFSAYVTKLDLPMKKAVKDFSRGMKMKLSIAIALSHNPRLLILDEATSGLDPIVRDELLDVFWEFIQDESHSIFISSHIISDLEKVCDFIAFIHKGKMVFVESKETLREKYGILKCSLAELEEIKPGTVIGMRKNTFGVEALVYRDQVPGGMLVDNASIEEIMLYYTKEGLK
ncbi:MAG: ABC transporter ATP-binding protein [Anaerolineaceae bacterium]